MAKIGLLLLVLMGLLSSAVAAQAAAGGVSRREFERLTVFQRARYFEETIVEAARIAGVDPKLIWAIAYNETRFRPWLTSKKDARGLMQFIPSTAARFGLRDPFDAESSIVAAARYVKYLSSILGGRPDSVLAAYNAGEGTVLAYLNGKPLYLGNKTINVRGERTAGGVPPYPETVSYVEQGLRVCRWLEHRGQLPTKGAQVGLRSTRSDTASSSRQVISPPKIRGAQNQRGTSADIRSVNSRTPRSQDLPSLPGNDRDGAATETELVYYDPRSGNRFSIGPDGPRIRLGQPGPVIVSPETRPGSSGKARTTAVGAAAPSKFSDRFSPKR